MDDAWNVILSRVTSLGFRCFGKLRNGSNRRGIGLLPQGCGPAPSEEFLLLLLPAPLLEPTETPSGEVILGNGIWEWRGAGLAEFLQDGAIGEAILDHAVDVLAGRQGEPGNFTNASVLRPAQEESPEFCGQSFLIFSGHNFILLIALDPRAEISSCSPFKGVTTWPNR